MSKEFWQLAIGMPLGTIAGALIGAAIIWAVLKLRGE